MVKLLCSIFSTCLPDWAALVELAFLLFTWWLGSRESRSTVHADAGCPPLHFMQARA